LTLPGGAIQLLKTLKTTVADPKQLTAHLEKLKTQPPRPQSAPVSKPAAAAKQSQQQKQPLQPPQQQQPKQQPGFYRLTRNPKQCSAGFFG
jgi:hypothetical protein